ncbi:MAG: D-glycero-beta-D-manno-heptose 1,7-bisphosphate 7-phosphatase [Gammaproteobacteria bacterium]|nr:D-glycero-beta-D-manno-heptose 1,7-bisphosphate 7-phosphatase [Gammaproteobacteria bacterium]
MSIIILDRDGVINHDSDDFIKSADEWLPIEGSLEAIAQFNHAGYSVAVATNQSGIARGLYELEDLHNMHKKMAMLLESIGGAVDAIFYCPHLPTAHCACRKPKPGMLIEIAKRFKLDSLAGVYYVGDSYRDIEAARAAGAIPVLVKTGKGQRTIENCGAEDLADVLIFDDLMAVANNLLVKK